VYIDLSVQVVPVIAAGFTFVFAGNGARCTRVGTARAVTAKKEIMIGKCILRLESTVDFNESD
jgi:hypothetical protein